MNAKFLKIVVSLILMINVLLCSSACTQNGSSKVSNSSTISPSYKYPQLSPSPNWDALDGLQIQIESFPTYVITYTTKLEYNNSVGSEWKCGVRYNGEYIASSNKIVITNSSTNIELVAFATELDEWDDNGTTLVTFDTLKVGEKQTKWATVIVRENEGRYTGNTAKWYFEITVERI